MQAQAAAGAAILRPWLGWHTFMRRIARGARSFTLLLSRYGDGNDTVMEVDAGLIARAQGGSHEAFHRIVDCYEERLRLLAFQMLGDAEQMNDALQDTFVKAYRALPRFRAEASLGTWLYRICYRVCLDYLGQGKGSPELELIDEELADPSDEPERLGLREELRSAIQALPVEQRIVLLLVDREGYDYATVAEVLDVPVGTVASRLSLARSTVRARLRPQPCGEAR